MGGTFCQMYGKVFMSVIVLQSIKLYKLPVCDTMTLLGGREALGYECSGLNCGNRHKLLSSTQGKPFAGARGSNGL